LTVFATLGTGEHYFVDLVASMPFAIAIQAIVSPHEIVPVRIRLTTAGIGLGLTLTWLFLVRYATKLMFVSPLVPWTLIAVSCIVVFVLQSRLTRSSKCSMKAESIRIEMPLGTPAAVVDK
jgi:hypothetical protein